MQNGDRVPTLQYYITQYFSLAFMPGFETN